MPDKGFDTPNYSDSLRRIEAKIDAVTSSIQTLNRKLMTLMGLVSVESNDLVQLDTDLNSVATAIEAKIQALIDTGTVPAGDLGPLQLDLANLRKIASPSPAPVPPPVPPTG